MGVFSTPGDLTWCSIADISTMLVLTLGHLHIAKYAEGITMNDDHDEISFPGRKMNTFE